MATWETDDEATAAMVSLPTPMDTPFRTPPARNISRGSRRSRRSVTPPSRNGKSSSPPPLPSDKASKRISRDVNNDDAISPLDPRRFTPTLHANLVSEILALRRDQEEKIKIMENLETALQTTQGEYEAYKETMSSAGKESRSLKRQLALLEGGTSSALVDLQRERDEAVESAAETRKRLDTTQKKLRSQEEDSERVHRQWAKEKDDWEEEKRKFERRIHVSETRLKAVLDEVTAIQNTQINGIHDGPETEVDENAKENDATSVRTMSLTNSIRFSVMSGLAKANGNSLADELGFDGGYDDESDYGGPESVPAANGETHTRNMSRDSVLSKSHSHLRRQSNDSLMRSGSTRGKLMFNHATLERLENRVINEDDETVLPDPKVVYVDSGIQYSPPPSPVIAPAKPSTPEPSQSPFFQKYDRLYDVDSPPRVDLEIEANQRRKRVHVGQPLTIKPPTLGSLMVNGSSQTSEVPLSPPKTPQSPFLEKNTVAPEFREPTTMVIASTQTDSAPLLRHASFGLKEIPIPVISVIPPTSRPSSSRGPRLPQLTKDFGCQVSLSADIPSRSVAVQTEEIRVRVDRLPIHLQPSTITSRPVSPALRAAEASTEETGQFSPVPGNAPPPRNPRRLASKNSFTEAPLSPSLSSPRIMEEETHDAYPGNNDNGPLSNQKAPIRRPQRISSLFAGFDANSSDEGDEFMDPDVSDSEYRTALSAPKPLNGQGRHGKHGPGAGAVFSDPPFLHKVHAGRYIPRDLDDTADMFGSANVYQSRESRDSGSGFDKTISKRASRPPLPSSTSSMMRKAAMIQNGIASHQQTKAPSFTDVKAPPPFPIPTRASSRKPPTSASAPSDGRASPTKGSDGWQRRVGGGRNHYRTNSMRSNSMRKVRSTTALARNQKNRRQGSRSPPPFPGSTEEVPESPGLPPLPANDITAPRAKDLYMYTKFKTHQPQLSVNTATTTNTGDSAIESQASSNQGTSVVDAIAQTMVGEWMFKYVRRRKSFGVSDGKGGDENSNDRHKRWVWLAPYERAILWSSKQPSSGSALMGKSGRKLMIQSVLDVKDDNPAPKTAGPLFNRSILILTPQRALKFTAMSAERHYIWLTSLSFLAHSNQAIPESLATTQPKVPPERYELPKPKARKPIRDSIRLTKAKATVMKSDPARMPPPQEEVDSVPPSIASYRSAMGETFSQAGHGREISRDSAEPPMIARFHDRSNAGQMVHGRKRSNTGTHVPPPLSFRGFSGPASSSYHAATNSTAGNSIDTAGSLDLYSNGGASSNIGSGGMTWTTGSVRTSEASSRPGGNNFFEAIGTIRMEAFISPLAFSRFEETPIEQHEQEEVGRRARRKSKELRRRASRSRQRDNINNTQNKGANSKVTDDVDDWYLRDDPFKGF
ncbi:hypothetical protein B0T17DRAFT_485871 [Bombardia bombarda]|uniref:Pleckstrin homology domain-containing protein n=1 Tax=Bombardia bombarda TaxID=252184 RepID=A0AA39XK99_9PEZI|nr:hypothetical protein B0T17DRAFT_485871 [Bombardia bombarda]